VNNPAFDMFISQNKQRRRGAELNNPTEIHVRSAMGNLKEFGWSHRHRQPRESFRELGANRFL
jgi:hypothetical protein